MPSEGMTTEEHLYPKLAAICSSVAMPLTPALVPHPPHAGPSFLVANATPQSAQDMAATVRGCLNCVVPRDPRDLVANDEKQKGPADGGRGVVLEALVLRHLGAALQGGDAAPGGFLKAISAVTG